MRSIKGLLSLAGAAALVASSTAAEAFSPAQQPINPAPWLTLSMLSPYGAFALGDASAAAQAQPDVPPPPPPVTETRASTTPPVPVIAIWLAEIALVIWIATRHGHHVRFANSPA